MVLDQFHSLAVLPADAVFDVRLRYMKDDRECKVDLGIGAYRDNNGKPWVLPSVKLAEDRVRSDENYDHEYLGISGFQPLTTAAVRVLLGEGSQALDEDRVVSVQSLSGTGALHLAMRLLLATLPKSLVYFSSPTWANHYALSETQGLETATYPYWDSITKSIDIEGFLKAINDAPSGSVFVLHACAHNPTGMDPTAEQWDMILDAIASKGHVALFDVAYQGFATGDLDRDAFAVRLGLKKLAHNTPVLICQSFAKNVGIYGERVGVFHIVVPRQDPADVAKLKMALLSQLNLITRSEVSNPPAYGAKVVAKVLNTPELTKQWHQDMLTMSNRIKKMRHVLHDKLVEFQTPGNWDHIIRQCGMFSFTGLTKEMVERMEKEHAVYLVSSGRISIAGLNDKNVEHVAKAIDSVVRHFASSKL